MKIEIKEEGVFLVGTLDGYVAEPWASDNTKVNHILGISKMQKNKFGQPEPKRYDIAVAGDPETIAHVQQVAAQATGKQVVLPVVPLAKPGRNGPWMQLFFPKGARVTLAA